MAFGVSFPTKVFLICSLSLMSVMAATHEVAGYIVDRRDEANMQRVIAAAMPRGPVMVDDFVRLDEVRAGLRGKQIIYSLTMISSLSTDVTREQWNEMASTVYVKARDDQALRPLFKGHYTVIYEYVGRDGMPIGRIELTPQDMLKGR